MPGWVARSDGLTRRAGWHLDSCTTGCCRRSVLGQLACSGATDADGEIKGWVRRLDELAQIDVEVKTAPGTWDDSRWVSGRILKINGDALLVASPGKFLPDKLNEIERFIDRLLAAFAGHD
jgi:hypothetical protein